MPDLIERKVKTEGHELHVVHGADSAKPMVVFLHGYPDSHRVWREAMQGLADEFFVVGFDMRGVGGSQPPALPKHYRLESVIEDIRDIIRELGHERAHLVAHDWGSTIGWAFVTHPEYRDMVLSWTTISGPHLAIWREWLTSNFKSLKPSRVGKGLWQLVKSSYVLYLLAWPIPDLVWRIGGVPLWRSIVRIAGVPKGDPMLDESREHVLSMTLRPMSLYRRNVLRSHPLPERKSVTFPVQLIIPKRDPFVSETSLENLGDYVTDLTIERLDASHWAPRSHPTEILTFIRGFLAKRGGHESEMETLDDTPKALGRGLGKR